jgi:hypothetical protein
VYVPLFTEKYHHLNHLHCRAVTKKSELLGTSTPRNAIAAVYWALGRWLEFYEHTTLVRCRASLEIVFPPNLQEFQAASPFHVVPSWLEMAEGYDVLGVTLFILEENFLKAKKNLGSDHRMTPYHIYVY